MHVRSTTEAEDRERAQAAFYGLVLREIGYDPIEAAALVIDRYPNLQPYLEKLARPRSGAPLGRLE